MACWIRYFFPQEKPFTLDVDRFAMLWRDAQFLLKMTKPIQADTP